MGEKYSHIKETGNVGFGVFVGCGDFEYGGNAEISPSIIHNEIINPANKDCFTSLNNSMNLSQRFHVIFPFVFLNQCVFKFLTFVYI